LQAAIQVLPICLFCLVRENNEKGANVVQSRPGVISMPIFRSKVKVGTDSALCSSVEQLGDQHISLVCLD